MNNENLRELTIEEKKQLNIKTAKQWLEHKHPEISKDSSEFNKFMIEVTKRNNGILRPILNGLDCYECWEQSKRK